MFRACVLLHLHWTIKTDIFGAPACVRYAVYLPPPGPGAPQPLAHPPRMAVLEVLARLRERRCDRYRRGVAVGHVHPVDSRHLGRVSQCTTSLCAPPCAVRCSRSRTARLAPSRRQAADLRADLAQRGRGQQRLTQHLLPPALPPGAHRARQAAVPACARAAPCEAATKADRGATARACLAPAREPLRSADGTPRGRRRKLVPSAARRAGPPAEKRAQPPAAREECGAHQLASEHGSARRAAHPSLPRPPQPAPPPTAERVGRQQRAPPRLPRVPLPAPQGTCSLRARGAGLC